MNPLYQPDGIYGFESPEYRWLSNFYMVPVLYEGIHYTSSEHAYQAAKTLIIADRERIANCRTPGETKKLGRSLKMREDWDQIKRQVMKDILRIKFQDPKLRQKLVDTGDLYLEETNWWGDRYWGVCRGEGQNHLGQVLMEIRQEIVNG